MECFFYDPFVDAFGGFPWIPDSETGEVVFRTPAYGGKGDMPWVSCEDDLGDIVHGIFLNPSKNDQALVQATSQQITMPDLAASYTQGTPLSLLCLSNSVQWWWVFHVTKSCYLQPLVFLPGTRNCHPGPVLSSMGQGAESKLAKCSGT
jgi:hypothetical protein